MNKTINQLSDLTQVENDDELVVWDITAGTSKKAKARQFKNIFISATSTTVTGAGIVSGDVVKIMFTSAITGSDTTTGLSISYNGTSIPVKVGKNGSLANFVASDISGTYTYLQAYTTLELAYDGTQFIVIGNPVVISNSDYTIYTDGKKTKYNIFPDYSDKYLIYDGTEAIDTTYTTPADGYLAGSGYGESQTTNYVFFTVSNFFSREQGVSDEYINNLIPVKKGTTVRIEVCLSKRNDGIFFIYGE